MGRHADRVLRLGEQRPDEPQGDPARQRDRLQRSAPHRSGLQPIHHLDRERVRQPPGFAGREGPRQHPGLDDDRQLPEQPVEQPRRLHHRGLYRRELVGELEQRRALRALQSVHPGGRRRAGQEHRLWRRHQLLRDGGERGRCQAGALHRRDGVLLVLWRRQSEERRRPDLHLARRPEGRWRKIRPVVRVRRVRPPGPFRLGGRLRDLRRDGRCPAGRVQVRS